MARTVHVRQLVVDHHMHPPPSLPEPHYQQADVPRINHKQALNEVMRVHAVVIGDQRACRDEPAVAAGPLQQIRVRGVGAGWLVKSGRRAGLVPHLHRIIKVYDVVPMLSK